LKSIREEPTICSGSTIGEQVAIEAYLRAMIRQFVDTQCKLKGCDQGFHNYLYYSNKLRIPGIRRVEVTKQGEGIMNNLAAMRDKPLREWGILKDSAVVLNWDGTPSPVVHQFDRDKELNAMVNQATRRIMSKIDV